MVVVNILTLIVILAAVLAFVWRRSRITIVSSVEEVVQASGVEETESIAEKVKPGVDEDSECTEEKPGCVIEEPQNIEQDVHEEVELPLSPSKVQGIDLQLDELAMRLHRLMEEEQYYLKPEARLDDFARELGTNRTYVTQLMRREYGLTFNEYVNVARIQHSQGILYSSPSMPMEDVATRSGFQSTSNYCRAFKRYTGTSPINWLKLSNPNVGPKRM